MIRKNTYPLQQSAFTDAYHRALTGNNRTNYSNGISNHLQKLMDDELDEVERQKAEQYYQFEIPTRHRHHR